MKTFKYRWKLEGKEYLGSKDCKDEAYLRDHIKEQGGELVEITSIEENKNTESAFKPSSYKPPITNIVIPNAIPTYASRGRRFLNFILDDIFLRLIFLVIAFNFAVALKSNKLLQHSKPNDIILKIYMMLLGIGIFILYYVITEWIWCKSPAKFITRTKVTMRNGTKPAFRNIVIRTLCRLIPFECLSFLGDSRPIGWHDRFSNTIVIEDSSIKR